MAKEKKPRFCSCRIRVDDYEREHLLPYKISELGSGIAWGDVNGDGFVDAYFGGAAGQAGQMFINNSGTSFSKSDGPWKAHAACEDKGILFFDAIPTEISIFSSRVEATRATKKHSRIGST